MNDYKDVISKNIKKYRKAAGLTQVELAKKLEITSASISNWEKGQNSIDIEMLFKLCNVLNISIDKIGSLESSAEYDSAEESAPMSPDQEELNRIYASLNTNGKKELLKQAIIIERSGMYSNESQSDSESSFTEKDDEDSQDGIA